MKKLLILLIICFIVSPLYLFADDEDNGNAETAKITESDGLADEYDNVQKERGPFRIKDRRVEVGLANVSAGFANDFLTTSQIFNQDKLVIDLDELNKGFKINFDLGITPLYFNYTGKDKLWGYGLSINIDAIGALNLSGDMLSLNEASGEKSDVSGAVFVDLKTSSFFHVKKIKTKFKASLSMYYPALYVDPDISYTMNNSSDATKIDLDYNLWIYTPISTEEGASTALSSTPGFDIQLGAEYPLAEVLGLKERFGFLDFIVGVDFINIPIVPSSMKDYVKKSGRIGGGEPIDLDNFENYIENNDDVYGSSRKVITRPFKMLAWADWKPFNAVPVSFIPTLGFAVNPLYNKPGSIEAGVKTRLDLANLFIATLGIGYHDRLWKNSVDLVLNFRFIEFNFGVDFRSQEFAKSWTGGGVCVNLGIKFGG